MKVTNLDLAREYRNIANPHKAFKETSFSITFKRVMSNPWGQFGLLGVILCVINLLRMAGVVPSSIADSIATVAIYSIASIGFCLLLGYSGLASLGTAGFVGIGIFMAYFGITEWGVTFVPALLIAAAVSILLGFVIGFISLRIEGIYLAILTLALSEVIVQVLKNLKASPSVNPFAPMNLDSSIDAFLMYFIIIIILVVFLVITANLIKSPTGRAMLAMKNSTSAAQAMGISLLKYRLFAFVISTVFAGVAGFLYMCTVNVVTTATSTVLMLAFSLNILGAVIVGGAKSLWGTLVGCFFVFGFQLIVLNQIQVFSENPTIMTLIIGVLMIVIVMFYPGGLAQVAWNIKFLIKKGVAKHRLKVYGIEA